MSKKLINGLKYEKLTEDQLYDLSQWELVDIILAYRKDYKAKEQECEELKNDNLQEVGQLKFAIGTLTAENLHLKELLDMRIEALCDSCKAGSMLPIKCRIYEKTLTEIKGLTQSMTDEFEDMDTEQQLCYCQQISKQILQKISECEGNND